MTRARDLADSQDNVGGAVPPFVAGKNKIINGDFAINQRAFTTDSVGGYNFDRFITAFSGGAGTVTAQTFTLGTAPVAGYEGKNFLRVAASSGNDYFRTVQPIESVRTFAGQTATLSFWAKGTNPSTLGYLNVALQQNFGTGGSPSATVTSAEQNLILTANWTRYSFTFNVPSIAGKTIGTSGGDKLDVMIGQISSTSTDSWTLDLWGVQFEAGSVATPFTTATGTIQGELAACQRYYQRFTGESNTAIVGTGLAYSTTAVNLVIPLPVTLRTYPSGAVDYSNLRLTDNVATYTITAITLSVDSGNKNLVNIVATGATGLTQYRGCFLVGSGGANYIAFSAEL